MIRVRHGGAIGALTISLFLIAPAASTTGTTQGRYLSGQTIAPIFEGWAPNPDGTYSLYFGYMNRNWQEELDIPIGPNNMMEPGPDGGQPTHFLTRRHKNVFRIVVPKNVGDKKIVWTLSIRGNTEKVPGSLNPVWQIDVARETRTGNTPPVVTVEPERIVTLPSTLTLNVSVTDDGLPSKQSVSPEPAGVTIEWSKYRGPGQVSFAPDKQMAVDGNATSTATFSAPGVYVLRVVADDGSRRGGFSCCWTNAEVKVTVNPSQSAANQR